MIRIFNVYYPTRTIMRLLCEVIMVCGSFVLATIYFEGQDSTLSLLYENGVLKISCIAVFTLLLSYYFDLYEPQRVAGGWEIYLRVLLVISVLSFSLGGLLYFIPQMAIGRDVFLGGVILLTIFLLIWRLAYEWAIALPLFREKVFVLGDGLWGQEVVQTLRLRRDAGMQVLEGSPASSLPADVAERAQDPHSARTIPHLDRIIVALENRRGNMPIRQLLNLRLSGIVVEDAHGLLERLTGRLTLAGLNPSALVFSNGFRHSSAGQTVHWVVSFLVAFAALAICLPIIPFIMLAIRLTSPGPIFHRQTRVGLLGRSFSVIKFRTMRQDAEANGAVWAAENDPRITPLGHFMRKTRLDEIPQLWNVLRGEMAFVGPRPERPEFVSWLRDEIPFYDLRHVTPPGITGWAQVRYKYGSSLEDTARKLEYDLYYIKHRSLGLDFLIMFETIKTIILRRGAQ